jgi:integrase
MASPPRFASATPKVTSRPAIIKPAPVGTLMRDICEYDGGRGLLVRAALQFIALTFVRPGEQRKAEWAEFDIAAAKWTIPKEKMKMRLPHEVPLSRQTLALLDTVRPWTGSGRYVFALGDQPMSDGTLNKALRFMGYDTATEHCAHGFRSTASTLLNDECKFSSDAIELQLAHVDDNTVRGTYNRAKLWPVRVCMMQHWADRLDSLRKGAEIIPLKRTRA